MLLEKLTSIDDKEILDTHRNTFGAFNQVPPNFTEINQEEFASGFLGWSVSMIEYRQITDSKFFKTMGATRLFYMNHGENYAIAHEYVKIDDKYTHVCRYFKFGDCLHDYKDIYSTITGQHTSKCIHCGDIWEYDSSD